MAVSLRYDGEHPATPFPDYVPDLVFQPGEEKDLTDIDQEFVGQLRQDSRFTLVTPEPPEPPNGPPEQQEGQEEDDE